MRTASPPGARFARRREVLRRLRPSPDAWFPVGHLPRWPRLAALFRRVTRAPVPAYLCGARVCLPNSDLARHVLITGLTGAHKTTAFTLPALADAAAAGISVVAFDLKYGEPDSLAAAAPVWWRCGRRVMVFAPLERASLRWNPLASCRSLGDAYEVAAHVFPDEADRESVVGYWTGAERHVCASLLWALATDGRGTAIGRLRGLAEGGPQAVAGYLQRHPRRSAVTPHLGAYEALLPKDQAGILQGIAARLESWSDDRVSAATADARAGPLWDQVAPADLRRRPALLLVGVPQAALPKLRGVSQLLMRMLAAQMLRPRGADETVPVVYILEELPAWGPVPALADLLATFRSRNVAVVATIQSAAQGESVYGAAGWAAIAANFVTKIYCASLADPDAEHLSRALGTSRVVHVSRSRGWNPSGRQAAEHVSTVDVPLRRPETLQGRAACGDEIIVRCAGLPPAVLWSPPYFARSRYAGCIADRPPSTAEINLAYRAMYTAEYASSGTGAPAGAAISASPGDAPAPAAELGVRDDGRARAELRAFAGALLTLVPPPEGVRVVRRGDRPVELRMPPALAIRLLGGPEAAQATLRRWAARRWVRHVRPTFVIERPGLALLDRDTLRRLELARTPAAAAAPAAPQGSGGRGV
jgi:type IV secretory pathway TraG/TraD family ATPase VirD4